MGFIFSQCVVIQLLVSSLSLMVSSIFISPTANLSTLWCYNRSLPSFHQTSARIVMFKENKTDLMLGMGCGFVRGEVPGGDYFAVFAVTATTAEVTVQSTNLHVLWIANRYKPVQENASLEFTSVGDLVLKDADGSPVWSTNTSYTSVIGIRIGGNGNLVLYNASGATIWQSFDHPTDTWLPGQRLAMGQRLVAKTSASNVSAGPLYVEAFNDGLHAFIESNPSQMYARYGVESQTRLRLNILGEAKNQVVLFDPRSSYGTDFAYVKLDSDGHLRAYTFKNGLEEAVDDIFHMIGGDCAYPTVCGVYGICSDGQCNCPQGGNESTSYFAQVDFKKPSLGCVRTTHLSWEHPQTQTLLQLDHVDYFNFVNVHTNVSMESCKQDCLKSRFCQAAVFRYSDTFPNGNCSLQNDSFSLKTNTGQGVHYSSTTFMKVQGSLFATNPNITAKRNSNHFHKIFVIAFSFMSVLVIITGSAFMFFDLRRKALKLSSESKLHDQEGDSIDQVSGMPKRFSFKDLKLATMDFSKKLGGGGFGSVFQGYMDDGTKIAVKRLDDLGQGRKEFLAEVVTIGCIHHVNLVRLIGFCAEDNQKLLVYEYMSYGSLDKWIFHRNEEISLNWETRKKIIIGIAKALSYLHEECQKKIVHLDIKPQNILLDENFTVKVADFGLARSIDRDESQILTPMRGTRGYLAPEWFSNKRISEKVDVYSFGIVLLEIVCGRKNLDYSLPDENDSLLHRVKVKAEAGQLFDIVDKQCEDIQNHREEVVKMIWTAIRCLHSDSCRRPSMAMVVKVFESVTDAKDVFESVLDVDISDYSFLTLTPPSREVSLLGTGPPSACILSGPR